MFYAGVILHALFAEIAHIECRMENYICPYACHVSELLH
jgi:hypothetical protein